MVEQNRSGTYTQFAYGPSGAKLAILSGQTLQKGLSPLPGGGIAVYNTTGLLYYGHPDHLGSIRLGSTPSRTIAFDIAYAPFGETYAASGTTDPAFTGQRQDTVAGLYDFPDRQYSTQGRWPAPDPAGLGSMHLSDPQTLNRYAYVRNNPLVLIDPQGLDEEDDDPCDEYDCLLDSGGGGGGGDPASGGDPNNSGGDCSGSDPSCGGNSGNSCPIIVNNCATQYPSNLADAILATFGVITIDFTPSEPGADGSFVGLDLLDPMGVIVVDNDVNSSTLADINKDNPSFPYTSWFGYTDPSDPYTNFAASDIGPYWTPLVQVWELGNSLALITGTPASTINQDQSSPGYNEPGYSFCTAVFGSLCPH